ncbi:MAG: hypothetical protein JW818_10685 [Pirellulales bacterium]|nr:hypothetical protein [Pirellulales bacterium]
MGNNPYQSPPDAIPVIGITSGRPEDVRSVAIYQKGILVCLLVNVVLIVTMLLGIHGILPAAPFLVVLIRGGFLLTLFAGLAFVFFLSTKVYNSGVGIVLGILAMVPVLNLLVLLVVNGQASTILRANGHRVGLLGVRLSKF